MSESKPVDLEAIRAKMPRQIKLGIGADIEDANALCDEVESLRERVKELAESIEHGCLRCGYVGPIPEPTKGDHP